jgi:hypothetical protein
MRRPVQRTILAYANKMNCTQGSKSEKMLQLSKNGDRIETK